VKIEVKVKKVNVEVEVKVKKVNVEVEAIRGNESDEWDYHWEQLCVCVCVCVCVNVMLC